MLPFEPMKEQYNEVVISKDQLWGEILTVLSIKGERQRKIAVSGFKNCCQRFSVHYWSPSCRSSWTRNFQHVSKLEATRHFVVDRRGPADSAVMQTRLHLFRKFFCDFGTVKVDDVSAEFAGYYLEEKRARRKRLVKKVRACLEEESEQEAIIRNLMQ
jgi:hypothetical protein